MVSLINLIWLIFVHALITISPDHLRLFVTSKSPIDLSLWALGGLLMILDLLNSVMGWWAKNKLKHFGLVFFFFLLHFNTKNMLKKKK